MIGLVFAVGLVVIVGYVCAALDRGVPHDMIRRVALAFLIALVIYSAVVFAAEVATPDMCRLYEKYSFMWYLNLCFIYEGSS